MDNLINANLNQNYFQFHGSHYKYKQGEHLGLPISGSIFKNFLQNLEGKFIKSNSNRTALIHYPTGCPRRYCTPDLFMFHPTRNVWIRQIPVGTPRGPHRAVRIVTSFVTSSTEFMVFKRCRYQTPVGSQTAYLKPFASLPYTLVCGNSIM